MQLYKTVEMAKSELTEAINVMASNDASKLDKLKAFRDAIRAEATIERDMINEGEDPVSAGSWEQTYNAIQQLIGLYRNARMLASKAADHAAKEAYARVMAEQFANVPDDLKEEMAVELDGGDWEFTTEY